MNIIGDYDRDYLREPDNGDDDNTEEVWISEKERERRRLKQEQEEFNEESEDENRSV